MRLIRVLCSQCVSHDARCDGVEQCLDGSDERQCPHWSTWYVLETPSPPAITHFDRYGFMHVKPLNTSDGQSNSSNPGSGLCPETHFRCPGNWTYCMPVFVRCNGVHDCPGREDEAGCDSYTCPGFYRCRASAICVHATESSSVPSTTMNCCATSPVPTTAPATDWPSSAFIHSQLKTSRTFASWTPTAVPWRLKTWAATPC